MRRVLASAAALAIAFPAAPGFAQEKLNVWWIKGFYKSRTTRCSRRSRFEAKTGVKVELSQYAGQDIIPKSVARWIPARRPISPMPTPHDVQVAGKWALTASSRTSPTSSSR